MYVSQTDVRVRYSETDQMGYVYYGNYASFLEVGRVEALRELGVSYKELENSGIMLPVLECYIKYLKPAYYDEMLLIKTYIKELPKVRIRFDYEIYNSQHQIINHANTTLVFVDVATSKPCPAPDSLIKKLSSYFS